MSRRNRWIAVLLPLALLAFMVGRAEWQLAASETWLFPMTGYDPRDLLRGHYLQFALDMPRSEDGASCERSDPECCYCLTKGAALGDDGFIAMSVAQSCETAAVECASHVRSRPLHALNRFYIPEDSRFSLEPLLRDAAAAGRAHLAVAVTASGAPMIEGVWIDGIPIEAVVDGGFSDEIELDPQRAPESEIGTP